MLIYFLYIIYQKIFKKLFSNRKNFVAFIHAHSKRMDVVLCDCWSYRMPFCRNLCMTNLASISCDTDTRFLAWKLVTPMEKQKQLQWIPLMLFFDESYSFGLVLVNNINGHHDHCFSSCLCCLSGLYREYFVFLGVS